LQLTRAPPNIILGTLAAAAMFAKLALPTNNEYMREQNKNHMTRNIIVTPFAIKKTFDCWSLNDHRKWLWLVCRLATPFAGIVQRLPQSRCR
jgi:hypothetical protein